MLDRTNIDSHHVRFVTVDFSEDDLFTNLANAGFDASKRTLFLWEGVTLYLSLEEVENTMGLVKERAAPGSILLADLYAERMIELYGKSRAGAKLLELTDEGLDFGLRFADNWEQTLIEFVEARSMKVGEAHFLGSNNEKGPYAVVAEMLC